MEVHVFPKDGKWAVELDGAQQGDLWATSDEAAEAGRALAAVSSAEFVMHAPDAPVKEPRVPRPGPS